MKCLVLFLAFSAFDFWSVCHIFLKLKMFFDLQSNLSHLKMFFISFSCQFVHLYSFHFFAESR